MGAVVVFTLAAAGIVGGFWRAGSNPGGNGHASAASLPTAATPTGSLSGRDATVSWTQSVVQGSPLGQLTAGTYTVTRYAESAPTTPIVVGGSCAGPQSGASDPMTCMEPSLSTGRWRYAVTPELYNWIGGESLHALLCA